MIVKLFLGLQTALLTLYGLYCLAAPESLAGGAGITASTITGTIELQSMYGGLQVGVGMMCLMGLLKRELEAIAMHALLFIFAGLGSVRVSLALMHGDTSGYTIFAAGFESFSVIFLLWYVLARPKLPEPVDG